MCLAALCGCGREGTRVSAHPATSLADEPVSIEASGLPRDRAATVTIASTDGAAITWVNRVRLRTDDHGRLDVPMTALTGMRPQGASLETSYVWTGAVPRVFAVTVASSGRTARAELRRSLVPRPLVRHTLRLETAGLDGVFLAPHGARNAPAILLFGGSEGGLSAYVRTIATHLAAHGYPVLALAYFQAPGLPATLSRVPLEYFARALRWLAARHEVDPHRIDTFGISRGSEAAQLVAVHWPSLVHGVVLGVPSDIVGWCFGPFCKGGAWSIGGRELAPGRKIPVDRIPGAVFALCAEHDQVWPSCRMADAIVARRRAAGVGRKDVLFAGVGASHYVSSFVPYQLFASDLNYTGRDRDEAAEEIAWPRLLAFLRSTT